MTVVDAGSSRLPATGNGAVRRREAALGPETEIVRLTEECETLRQLVTTHEADMEALRRRTDELIAATSHDLISPLTVVLGSAQYVARLLDKPQIDLDLVRQKLAVIQKQGAVMTGLLDDFLDSSRFQQGAFEVRPTRCDMDVLLTTVLSRLASGERERVDVTVPDAPLEGLWDQKRLERVLANLIGNALKYSPYESRVTVTARRAELETEVSVGDGGIGIPAGDLVHIFERFYRTPQAEMSGQNGAGLGLYICYCIIAAHGGRIWAESAGEHHGATFRFTLPNDPLLG